MGFNGIKKQRLKSHQDRPSFHHGIRTTKAASATLVIAITVTAMHLPDLQWMQWNGLFFLQQKSDHPSVSAARQVQAQVVGMVVVVWTNEEDLFLLLLLPHSLQDLLNVPVILRLLSLTIPPQITVSSFSFFLIDHCDPYRLRVISSIVKLS
jgi:hypothetical protein